MEVGPASNYHPKKPVLYKDIAAYVQEKYGVKVYDRLITQVKRQCGLPIQNFTPKPREVPCPPDRAEYIKDALRHFGLLP